MSQSEEPFIVLSINHEKVALELRERYSADEAKIARLYDELGAAGHAAEYLVLNTCNRFELYTQLSDGATPDAIIALLAEFYGEDAEAVRQHLHLRCGQDAIQHLIEVSAGLRSQITGEAEIFGQVKSAYAYCQTRGGAGKIINRIFQKGFQAAKLIRNSTPVGEGQINISNVAVDLAAKIFGTLDSAAVLSLGTGEIGEKTVKALRSRGVTRFGVASRSADRASAVAQNWGGDAYVVSDLARYLSDYDIVIASVGADYPVVTRKLVKSCGGERGDRPLFLIDLGLPRNVERGCEDLDNVFLYNLDDLAAIADQNLSERKKAVEDSRIIAAQKSQHIWDSIQKRGLTS